MMADGVLTATAWHNPKDIAKVVGSSFDDGHDPQEPSDFEDWSWGDAAPTAE